MNRLPENESVNTTTFKPLGYNHAGMLKKPLAPYNPNSYRSRLPIPTVVMPYKNSSQIVIGDRSTTQKKHFLTTNQSRFFRPDSAKTVSNPGIVA